MANEFTENNDQILDTRSLSNMIFEFNVSRRHVTAYPKGHPVIETSASKVLSLIEQLLEFRDSITIGIAKDSLMIDSNYLEKNNPIYREFAKILFERGVALLTFTKNLSIQEIKKFNEILTLKTDIIHELGGMRQLIEHEAIEHIIVQTIDYGLFHLSEGGDDRPSDDLPPTDNIWDQFVNGLLSGSIDPAGRNLLLDQIETPEKLASYLNSKCVDIPEVLDYSYDEAVTSFVREMDRRDINSKVSRDSVTKLGQFVKSLNPQIRRLFLHSSMRSLADCRQISEEVVTRFPDELILEAIQESSKTESYAPPVIMTLLQKLAKSGISENRITQKDHFENSTVEELLHKFRVIFREDELDKFIPKDYQTTLSAIISSKDLTSSDHSQVDYLKETLNSHNIESQVSNIIMDIMKTPPDDWLTGVLERSLIDLCDYFVSIGDFSALLKIHSDIQQRLLEEDSQVASNWEIILYDVFNRVDFMDEVLRTPVIWGKAKFEDIRGLISKIGEPFVEPLFNNLAEEESMWLRRFYMDRLIEMGEKARDAAILRLSDNRWYFVRNILIILRTMNDPVAVKYMYRLNSSQHPRIRHELIKTFLHFKDPEGDKLLLLDLESEDDETRANAIQLAGKSRDPRVNSMLLQIINGLGWSTQELEIKKTALTALSEIGLPQTLHELELILKSVNIFHWRALNKFKIEIIRSLERYPADKVNKFLSSYIQTVSGDLEKTARETLKLLKVKHS